MLLTTKRTRRCACCKTEFAPARQGQRVCSIGCAQAVAVAVRTRTEARAQRDRNRETKQALEKIKPRSQWMKEAQVEINRYARLRDRSMGCISCDKPATWDGQWHASHFRSIGAASAVRFNLLNIHKSCSVCNNHLSGNISSYRPRLIEKIGVEKVAWLESQNQIVRYDIEYLKRLKKVFARRANKLAKMVK